MTSTFTNSSPIHRAGYSLLFVFLLPFFAISNTDIIGDIWTDFDLNYMYDGEAGISGVTVRLVENETENIISTSVSVNGKFEFLNINPGKYYLQIPASEFLQGGALFGLSSCPGFSPADDMIDNNDNGSDSVPNAVRTGSFTLTDSSPGSNVLIEEIDFCFFVNSCDSPNPLGSMSCAEVLDATILCDMGTFNSFCHIMPQQNFSGTQPLPLCPDGDSEAENITWFGFVAAEGDYILSISSLDCVGGFGLSGIQVGIYQDCSFEESIFCSPDCMTSPIEISSDLLTPGETYYLFIDGCNGTVCSYEFHINGNISTPSLEPDDVCVNNNGIIECDSTNYCIGGDIYIEATGLDLSAAYQWTITTISGGPYLGSSTPMTTDENLNINFSGPGRYEVCVTSVQNGCSEQEWVGNKCTLIKVSASIPFAGDEIFTDQFVCLGEEDNYDITNLSNQDPNNDGVFGWQGSTADIGLGLNITTVLTPGCSYDQSFELDTNDEEPPFGVYLAICGQDLPLQIENFTLTEESFADNDIIMIESVLSQTPNQNGCDSIINYAIEKLDVADGFMNAPQCTFNSIVLDFDYNASESTNFIFLNFVWEDPFGNILFDSQGNNDPTDIEILTGNPSGTYTLNVTITKNGFSCTYVYPVEVDFTDITPPTPSISGLTFVCGGSNGEVTYIATGGDPSFNYIWGFPADVAGTSTSGPLGNMLTIDWNGSNGGQVTVQSENECGFSEITSLDITVIQTNTPEFILDSEVCLGDEISVSSTGNDVNISSYIWNFDGAQVIEGNIFNFGPNILSWNTPGTKTITLITSNTNGCLSDTTSMSIDVIAPMDPTTIICQPTINDVLFIWQPSENVDYSVDVVTGQTGQFEGNSSYRVSGLNGGDLVTIQLIQTSTASVCTEPVTTTSSCSAMDCPVISIALSANQLSFCENESANTQINVIVNSDANGTGTFSGPGIVDPSGLFNPSSAEIGVNTITYTYIDENGCAGLETIDLAVTPSPIASIVADQTTVCIGNPIQLNYSGGSVVDGFDWQNAEVTIPSISNPTVTFTTLGTKVITLRVTSGDCVSELASISITVEDSPEATFTLSSDVICISDEVQLLYTGGGDIDVYEWNAGIGNIDNVPNPSISFNTTGEQTIELIVNAGECTSEIFSQTILVEPELEEITISCNSGSGFIDFDWNDINGVSDYMVIINGESPNTTSTTNFTVTGLTSNELVQIEVVAISDGACPNVSTILACTSLISSTLDKEVLPIAVYPNPVQSILYLEDIGDLKQYTILDLNGRIILEGQYDSGINMLNFSKGLYFLKLTSADQSRSQILKFLKG